MKKHTVQTGRCRAATPPGGRKAGKAKKQKNRHFRCGKTGSFVCCLSAKPNRVHSPVFPGIPPDPMPPWHKHPPCGQRAKRSHADYEPGHIRFRASAGLGESDRTKLLLLYYTILCGGSKRTLCQNSRRVSTTPFRPQTARSFRYPAVCGFRGRLYGCHRFQRPPLIHKIHSRP